MVFAIVSHMLVALAGVLVAASVVLLRPGHRRRRGSWPPPVPADGFAAQLILLGFLGAMGLATAWIAVNVAQSDPRIGALPPWTIEAIIYGWTAFLIAIRARPLSRTGIEYWRWLRVQRVPVLRGRWPYHSPFAVIRHLYPMHTGDASPPGVSWKPHPMMSALTMQFLGRLAVGGFWIVVLTVCFGVHPVVSLVLAAAWLLLGGTICGQRAMRHPRFTVSTSQDPIGPGTTLRVCVDSSTLEEGTRVRVTMLERGPDEEETSWHQLLSQPVATGEATVGAESRHVEFEFQIPRVIEGLQRSELDGTAHALLVRVASPTTCKAELYDVTVEAPKEDEEASGK